MSDLKVCRICLNKDVKVYNYDQYNLNQYYEQVMSSTVNYNDGLPHYFCYVCAAMLHNCHKFRQQCHIGQKILKEQLWSGPLTLSLISQIDRQSIKLTSSIGFAVPSKRVTTCIIKSNSEIKQSNDTNSSEDDITKSKIKTTLPNYINNPSDYEKEVDIKSIHESIEIKIEFDQNLDPIVENFDDFHNNVNLKEDIDFHSDNDVEPIAKNFKDFHNNVTLQEDKYFTLDNNVDPIAENFNDFHNNMTLQEEKDFNADSPYVKDGIVKYIDLRDIVPAVENTVASTLNNDDNNTTQKKKNSTPINHLHKKFTFKTITKSLDPQHWLKIKLSEEEALNEFKARAEDPKYFTAEYKCTKCLTQYSKEDMLIRHMLKHTETTRFECNICSLRFMRKYHLMMHLSTHYTKYKCLRCDLTFVYESSALCHNDYHSGFTKKCRLCGEKFRHRSTYYSHLRLAHRSEYVCTVCGASFVSEAGLQKHKRNMHLETIPNLENSDSTYCDRCDIIFGTKMAYTEHLKTSAKHTDVDSVENMAKGTFIVKSGLKKPIYVRLRRKPKDCEICGMRSPSYQAYVTHLSEHAPNGRLHCPRCGKPVKPKTLEAHQQRACCTKEGSKHCIQCGGVVDNDSTKPHECTSENAIEVNMRIYKRVKSDQPIVENGDKEHRICPICGVSLKIASMATHMFVHNTEKFPCPTCGREFNNKTNLKRHQLIHTGEKPFKCPSCDTRFTQQGSMKLHYRTVHLKEPYPKRKPRKRVNPRTRPKLEKEENKSDEVSE